MMEEQADNSFLEFLPLIGNLSAIDYAVLIVIGLSVFFAMMRGFILSVLSFMGWVFSIYITYKVFPLLQPILDEAFHNPLVTFGAGYIGIFLVLLILFGVLNFFIKMAIGGIRGDFFDRVLGVFFGFIRGLLFVSLVFVAFVVVMNILNDQPKNEIHEEILPQYLKDAKSYKLMKYTAEHIINAVPDGQAKLEEDLPIDDPLQ
jgi:uncharacterized membrane protein required for colicin V production